MKKNLRTTDKMNFRLTAIISALLPAMAGAQTVTYDEYMKAVARDNAEAIAEKYNLDIAEANLKAAKVFNDPELGVSYGNNQDWDLMMGQNVDVELGYNFSLGGVRRARINASMSEKDMTEASLNAFMCRLRAEASIAWVEAWKLKEMLALLEEEADSMQKIASGDSLRLQLGDISKADAMQSALEARSIRNEVMGMKSEYSNALSGLSYMAGGMEIDGIEGGPDTGELKESELASIYEIAERERADLRAAELSHKLSENNLALVKASRAMEIGVSLGYSFNTEVRNEIAPAPTFHGLVAGVSIPLKFSSANKGELNAAEKAREQQKSYYDAARQQVMTEVTQAYTSWKTAREVLAQYDEGMTGSAREIYDSRKEAYARGDSSLLELLSARSTYNDIMSSYIEAACNYRESTILLRQAIGR